MKVCLYTINEKSEIEIFKKNYKNTVFENYKTLFKEI